MNLAKLLTCFWLATGAWVGAQAQDSGVDKAVAADAAYRAKDWPRAERLYGELAQAPPDSARNSYRFGACLQAAGKHQEALVWLEKAKAKGGPAQSVEYSLAQVYASMGQKEPALGHLTEAVKQGWGDSGALNSDVDLKSIRDDARFAGLVEQAKHNEKPCAFTAENRQFDFWIGDWDVVTTQDGVAAGVSHIESAIGDCVIWENWMSLGTTGYAGRSYNTYNASLKRWEQFWVDNVGGMVHFHGGLKDGVMDFFTDETPQPGGTRIQRHLRFFQLGADRVRQYSETSTDGGKTWAAEYDLTYNRKK